MVKLKNIPGLSALHGKAATSSPTPDGSSGAVTVIDHGVTDKVNLRTAADNAVILKAIKRVVGVDLPVAYNSFHEAGTRACVWLGPDEWLILGENGASDDIIAELDVPEAGHIAVTEVSDAYGMVTVKGAHVRDALAKHCALDLHVSAFTKGMCAQTFLAHAGVILMCQGDDKFMVIGRTSFMEYIYDLLEDAALEYGFNYIPAK